MKKKLLFLLSVLFVTSSIYAQLPVSTTPENKNVVLEEFTGIYCVYCPDGHKRAKQFANSHPGDVVLINVHEGGFAQPSQGDPDFRTDWGENLGNEFNVQSWPAGMINRHEFKGGSPVMGRGDWATYGNQTLAQSSYVNIALEGELDVISRTLTVNAEIYFTDTTAPSQVFLNVVIMQNNVEGPQTGMTANPDQILPNGNYNHEHMFRLALTDQWGDEIDTTAEGSLIKRQYTYVLPEDIEGIDLLMADLELAAFITETRRETVTGAYGPINFVTPPGVELADLSLNSEMTAPMELCEETIIPKVTVTNNESFDVSDFEVSYTYAGATESKLITATLGSGQSTTVSFDPETVAEGSLNFDFSVKFSDTASYIDIYVGDNKASSVKINKVPEAAFDDKIFSTFESSAIYPASVQLENAVLDNTGNIPQYIISQEAVSDLSHNLGGFGRSAKSYWLWLKNSDKGVVSSLIYDKTDLSNSSNTKLVLSYAYAQMTFMDNDKLEILLSKDCGANWTTAFSKSGATLSTTDPVNASRNFFPDADEWKADTVDVSQFDGEPEVAMILRVTSGKGNGLFIDNVMLLDSDQIGLADNKLNDVKLSIYPNPVVSELTITCEEYDREEVQIKIMDLSGKTVKNITAEGSKITVDVSQLKSGTYILETKGAGKTATKKLVISK